MPLYELTAVWKSERVTKEICVWAWQRDIPLMHNPNVYFCGDLLFNPT